MSATHNSSPPPLDQPLSLDQEQIAFFMSQTGIFSERKLRDHILSIQAEAYRVAPYPCIRRFSFTSLKISHLLPYGDFLQLGREREGAIFLDVGCCFGNDTRKAIADGWPVQNVITSDIHPEFWELGHKLFRSTSKTLPVPFVSGDIFDPAHLTPGDVVYEAPTSPVPELNSLKSLTLLQGHVSAIHASALFHLFDEVRQLQLARALASLLSSAPGSMIFGSHNGLPTKGENVARRDVGHRSFCHSPESWVELWDGIVFKRGTVRVNAMLQETNRPDIDADMGARFYSLIWSVTRV